MVPGCRESVFGVVWCMTTFARVSEALAPLAVTPDAVSVTGVPVFGLTVAVKLPAPNAVVPRSV